VGGGSPPGRRRLVGGNKLGLLARTIMEVEDRQDNAKRRNPHDTNENFDLEKDVMSNVDCGLLNV
jgi:hypothetical protein